MDSLLSKIIVQESKTCYRHVASVTVDPVSDAKYNTIYNKAPCLNILLTVKHYSDAISNDIPQFFTRVRRHAIFLICNKTTWWRHQMETSSAYLAICAGNSPVTGEFPAQRPVTQSFDVFFDLRQNKRLNKQWWGWWFETPPRPLWRHCNGETQFNSSPPSAAHMRGSSLPQVMDFHPFGSKQLPEPVLLYCQLDYWEQISLIGIL